MKRSSLLIITIVTIPLLTHAREDSVRRFSFTPLPIILFDPFMGTGFGGLVNVNYLIGVKSTTRYSNAQVYLLKTTKGQFAAQINHTTFTNHEEWMLQGKAQYLTWPENTYAEGARTPAAGSVKEKISYQAIETEERIMKRCGTKNFIGMQYRYYRCANLQTSREPALSYFISHGVGTRSFTASGAGPHFMHDSRDNVQNALSGRYLEIAVNPYLKATGSTQNWMNLRADLRTYSSLEKGTGHSKVLASRVLLEHAAGEVPYMLLPMTGRYNTTRGYVQGRFRGHSFVSAETEYRAHIWKRLGYVVFGGAHSVSEPGGTFRYINPACGGGLRMMLNKEQRTNLRIDYARGIKNEGGLYLQITEAF